MTNATPSSDATVTADPKLSLQNVTISYGSFEAVRNVYCDIPRGKVTAFIGPSGCGKTTTLRLIAGHETASDGSVLISNREVTGAPPARRGTAMMFQNYALFPHLNCLENVAFSLRMQGIDKEVRNSRAMELLSLVHMETYRERMPSQLSGGQQQRIALARALITKPDVLLLDEPFGMLDSLTRNELQDVLLELWQRDQKTALMVTHDVDEALFLADRVVMMTNGPRARVGKIIEVSLSRPRDRAEVLEDPQYYPLREELISFLEEQEQPRRGATAA